MYAARDPELSRNVALEILGAGDDAAPLRRLAQVKHPNVIAVHDVGSDGERVFVAMELVDGQTLDEWLAAAPRRRLDVVSKFVAAGQGLAAAHAAGVVHGDFQAAHVLVGKDGRVRVGGFGHARGQAADARADQLGFCVAFYQAMCRAHPFADDQGTLRAPPRPDPLPRALRRLLVRGLARAPEQRFASMDELLAALARARSQRRTRVAVAGLLGLALVGLALGVVLGRQAGSPAPCQGAEQKWTDVWDARRAGLTERRFAATGEPYAANAFAEVNRAVSAYRHDWLAMHTEACEATRVRHRQSEELLEKRMMCLDALRHDARALTDRFVAADAHLVENAARVVTRLGDLSGCADLKQLSGQVAAPAQASARAHVAELRGQLAEVKAARLAGGNDGHGAEQARALVSAARATQYRALEAEALFELGWVEDGAGDYAAAARTFEQAVWAAEASRHDDLAVRSWGSLMMEVGERLQRPAEALAMRPRITALIERLGGSEEMEGNLRVTVAQALYDSDRFAEAKLEADKALALFEHRFGPDDLHVSDVVVLLGDLARRDDADEARRYYQRSLDIRQKIFGPDHPQTATSLDRVASALWTAGKPKEAITAMEKAIAIYERVLDPEHPHLAKALNNLGMIYESLGELDKALGLHQRAVEIGAKVLGTDHPDYADFLNTEGDTLEELGRHDEALVVQRQALAVLERSLGAEHTQVAECLMSIVRILYFTHRYSEARPLAARALAIRAKQFGPDATEQREPLLFMGWCDLELGAPAQALAELERAYTMRDDATPQFFASIEFALARALIANHGDRRRAVTLARAARIDMGEDALMAEERKDVDRWLAQHAR